ncbi:MAG: hypothetical protein SFV19_06305 [Rhodospirillaceae bacterium]|nr:hypothetical protein [Rhodospirillaceae bacterium]
MTALGDIWRRLLAFGRGAPDTDPAPDDTDTAAFDIKPAGAWDEGLDLTLSKLVTETETKASGRVQVLTLAHLRSELGEAWPRYRARVLMIAETTIGRMIGKGNTFIPQGSEGPDGEPDTDSWLLLMSNLSEREAEERADDIAKVLGEKLVGERFSEKEPPLPQTAKVDLSTALNPDGSFNTAQMKLAVKRARIMLAAKDVKKSSQALDAGKKPAGGIAAKSLELQRSLFPGLTLVYRPLWVADTENFAAYALRAFTDTGEPVFGPNTPAHVAAAINDATMVDLAKVAFADFMAMTKTELRATYVLPVPFGVMTRKLGGDFLRALAALPQRERLMQLRIELVNLPERLNAASLAEVRELFRGRVRDVAILMDLARLNDTALALDHVALGAEVTPAVAADAEFADAVGVFRRRAGAKRAYVIGIRSRAQASLALKAGVDEISGAGLADDMRHLPDRASVLFRDQVLRAGLT